MHQKLWWRRALAVMAGAALTLGAVGTASLPAGAEAPAQDHVKRDGPRAPEPQKPARETNRTQASTEGARETLGAQRTAAAAITNTYLVDTEADDSSADSSSTACATDAGDCSLRAALEAANADGSTVDRIVIPAGLTITLQSDDLPVQSHVVVDGGGATTVIDGDGSYRAFDVSYGNLELSGVTIRNARGQGAAVHVNPGAATLSNVIATGNDAGSSDGGAVYVSDDSSLWVDASTFAGNTADDGGAIYVYGAALISDSVIGGTASDSGNVAASDGGGIYVDYQANLSLVDSSVRNNRAVSSGGGIYNDAITTITGGAVSDNVVEHTSGRGWGGGIANDGVIAITGAEVARNVAIGTYTAEGGGLYNNWQMQLTNVSVDDNSVVATSDSSSIEGAGVYNGYNLSIRGGTVSGNRAEAIGDQSYDDGVLTEGSTTLTSDAANFTSGDIGSQVTGTGIPEGTTISTFVNEAEVELSQAATADGAGVAFTIVDRIASYAAGAGLYTDYTADVDGTVFDGNLADTKGSDADDNNSEYVEGGAIVNWYTLALRDVTVTNTVAKGDDVYGGAILLDDQSSLENVTVSNTNVVSAGDIEGGAIANWYDGTYSGVKIDRTTATITEDSGYVYGGAFYHYDDSPTTINDSSVTATTLTVGDDATIYGGAVDFEYEVNANNFTVSGTRLTTGANSDIEGGGLYAYWGGNFTDLRVDDNQLTVGNASEVDGGGFYTDDWATVSRASISGNRIVGGDDLWGVGMYAYYGLNGDRITFANNVASTEEDGASLGGGGLYTDDKAQLTNVTISGNSVTATGSAAEAEGGGIYADYPMTLTHATVANNTASGTTDDATSPETDETSIADAGAAVYATANVVFANSIVAGNAPAVSQCSTGTSESVFIGSVGSSIDSGESCNFTGPGDLENTDPLLGALQDNGGPGLTHALLAGSPAIDAATAARCPAVDERGQARPVGNGCDIGAYEYVFVPVTPPPPAGGGTETPVQGGYWLAASDGGVFTFGGAGYYGSTGGMTLNQPIVSMASTPTGKGYWLVASDGGVFTFGDAGYFGSMGGTKLNKPIVGMVASPSGNGYWLVASDGGIFTFGDAPYFGSTGAMTLNAPIVNMAIRPNADGYWLVASDGGVFTFGSAVFHGSTGAMELNKPIVDMIPTSNGTGYWLLASDGGLFTFGNATFLGSMGGSPLNSPIVDGARSATGAGYFMTAADGGVFTFGDALYAGSTGGTTLNKPIVTMSVNG